MHVTGLMNITILMNVKKWSNMMNKSQLVPSKTTATALPFPKPWWKKGNAPMLLACTAMMILGISIAPIFGGSALSVGILLLCPLLHVGMMMKGKSCHGSSDKRAQD
jgi:hypothetical protein